MEDKVPNIKTDKNTQIPLETNVVNVSTTTNFLDNPLEFLMIKTPIDELKESKSAIIHIKNTCKNSFCNCYVNCFLGHTIKYNTFLNTSTGTKYLFQTSAEIIPDYCSFICKENIKLKSKFKSLTKSNTEEIYFRYRNSLHRNV